MHQTSSFLGIVERFEEPDLEASVLDVPGAENKPSRAARLVLKTGREFLIDPSDSRYHSWAHLLKRRVASHQPIYIKTDSEAEYVNRIEIPRRRKISKIFPIPGLKSFGINVVASPRTIFLAGDNIDRFLDILKAAQVEGNEVLITVDQHTNEVLDVRPFLVADEVATTSLNFSAILTPTTLVQVLTPLQVLHEFGSLASQNHIPFDFPKDCCNARAHEMFRLLSEHGFTCRKIWNYGGAGVTGFPKLTFFTFNDPAGLVQWEYHVAPLVKVQIGNDVAEMVIDPSMSNKPLRVPDWLALQHDTTAVQEIDIPEIFEREIHGANILLDPGFFQTWDHLRDHIDERDAT
jgi:hypothetical protein